MSKEDNKKPQSPYNQQFGIPNYFQCPNQVVDDLLPLLDNSEIRVLLVVTRQTLGWHKPWDRLSSKQLSTLSGCSQPTAIKAAIGLEEKGHILVRYVCPGCKKIVDPPENRGKDQKFKEGHEAPECQHCQSRSAPQKWYALNIQDEDMEAYLLWMIETGNTDDETLKNLTGGIKGFNRGVLKDLIGGYKETLYTKDINTKDNKKDNDHDHSFAENSDLTIVTGAILEKWGKQLVQPPPQAQVTTALQELGKAKILEAIQRAPLVLKDPDPMKIVGFVIKVAEHPTWYRSEEEIKDKVKNTYEPGELDYSKGRNVVRTYRLMPDDIACKRGMVGLRDYYEKYKDYGERVGMELSEYLQIIAKCEQEGVL